MDHRSKFARRKRSTAGIMGIYDRDYMKRRPEDDGRRRANSSSVGAGLDAFFARFLKRHPRFFIYLMAALAIFIIIGLVAGDPKQ